jgi:uncharacterized protein YecT (DUF1311 family)
MKLSALIVVVALCFLFTPTGAAQKGNQDPCANAATTVEMSDCMGKEYQKVDAELNRVYKQLMATLDNDGEKAALKTAQQAWLKYRDLHCEFESYENKGGTIYPIVYTGCLSAVTSTRTKELRETLKDRKDR